MDKEEFDRKTDRLMERISELLEEDNELSSILESIRLAGFPIALALMSAFPGGFSKQGKNNSQRGNRNKAGAVARHFIVSPNGEITAKLNLTSQDDKFLKALKISTDI